MAAIKKGNMFLLPEWQKKHILGQCVCPKCFLKKA
jgi:hypothetical protein